MFSGVTFVFMTGVRLASLAFNQSYLWLIPGWEQTFTPSSAVDGIRIKIDSPGAQSDPIYRGVDIAPGYSTMIGVTGREVIKLPPPYSDCTKINLEREKLREILERDVPGNVIIMYNEQTCSRQCLAEHVLFGPGNV